MNTGKAMYMHNFNVGLGLPYPIYLPRVFSKLLRPLSTLSDHGKLIGLLGLSFKTVEFFMNHHSPVEIMIFEFKTLK